MTQYLTPFSGRQFLDANGNPYVGAKLFAYAAGSSTKVTLTKDSAGSSNHTNPIILNARGEPADGGGSSQAMWQAGGVAVKLVLAPANDTDPPLSAISSWDNLTGINDTVSFIDQWQTASAPTYVSANTFSVVGDQTNKFSVNRRIKAYDGSNNLFGTITSSVFGTNTQVTCSLDDGAVFTGMLTVIFVGFLIGIEDAIPGGIRHANTTINGTTTVNGLMTVPTQTADVYDTQVANSLAIKQAVDGSPAVVAANLYLFSNFT